MTTEKLKRELGFRDVFLFYLVSGLSLRWIATAAASGQSAIVVWLLAWGGFFLLLAGRVLELSSRYPQAHVKDLIFWSTLFFAFTGVRHAAGLRDADQLLCAQTRPTSPLLALGARLKVRRRKHGLKRFPPQLPFSGNRKARRPNPGFDSPAVSYHDQWLMCRRIHCCPR